MNAAGIEPLTREIFIQAKQQTVYGYFTKPDKMQTWKGQQARLDPRPGGEYWVDINGVDKASGKFLELEPFDRVLFTWGWEGENSPMPPGSSTVEVLFIDQSPGTLVRLTHSDLSQEQMPGQAAGWDRFLPKLAEAVEAAEK